MKIAPFNNEKVNVAPVLLDPLGRAQTLSGIELFDVPII
jgi:hypothetical protein